MKYGWYVVYLLIVIANASIVFPRLGTLSPLEILILDFGPTLCFLAGKWIYKKEE